MKRNPMLSRFLTGLLAAACSVVLPIRAGAAPERFATADEAIKAFTAAALNKDTNAFHVIFGPEVEELVSADSVQASNGLVNFSRRVSECVKQITNSESGLGLDLGYDNWPFPIPLVKDQGQWFFDTAAGKEEILNRRIGRDELDTIRVCHAYAAAQREYASEDRSGEGVLEYARHFRSTPGKHDGLYWHAEPGEEISPLGPLIAESHVEGYRKASKIMTEGLSPFHGYFFKILTRQGSSAPGGKYSYIINGHMIGGFALVAWPAEWANTGVMTFIINQQGKVYERNLGPKTDAIAAKMTTYDPGPGWKPAE
jgi:hypothetical protein